MEYVWEVNQSITTHRDQVYLRQRERSGKTYFVLNDLWMWYADQGRCIVNEIGPDRPVCGAHLPLKYFESHHGYWSTFLLTRTKSDKFDPKISSRSLIDSLLALKNEEAVRSIDAWTPRP